MAAPNPQSPTVRTHFKTPEGRYKLSLEKTHPTSLLPSSHGKFTTKVTFAQLKDKPVQTPSSSSSSSSVGGVGARFSVTRFLGTANGGKGLAFGGNGFPGRLTSAGKGTTVSTPNVGVSNGPLTPSYDGEGSFLIFNVGDTLYISDYNTQDKDPIKCLQFSTSNPVSHTFDPDAKDGHDLLIGLSSGDVYTTSLRQQLQDPGKKIVGGVHYNKDGVINSSRCTSVAWVPHTDGMFVVAHADGNLYVYDKNKDGSGDAPFPPVRDPFQFSVTHAKSSKSNPIARWHMCQGAINEISFSHNGVYLASVGRDGYLRTFDYAKEQLACGSKSYYGALLCCAWSPDNKYVLTGGEDDLVQVWSMEDQRVVAWGVGHSSWVSAVAFDPFWIPPPSVESEESVTYRFGSVGQDTQLLLWDLSMEEVVVPYRRLGGTLSGSTAPKDGGTQSARWETAQPLGILHPAPTRQEVPKISPVMAHRVHAEQLTSIIFMKEAIITACYEANVKIWERPLKKEDSSPLNPDECIPKEKMIKVRSGGIPQLKL